MSMVANLKAHLVEDHKVDPTDHLLDLPFIWHDHLHTAFDVDHAFLDWGYEADEPRDTEA